MKLVLLPGLDGTGLLFQPFIDALPAGIDCIVVSYPASTKLSYQELIEFVVKELPEEDFILLGESFSGYIAYQVSLRQPKHLKSVVFVASFLEVPRPLLLKWSSWLPMSLLLSVPIPNLIFNRFLLGKDASSELVFWVKNVISQVLPEVLSFRLEEVGSLQGCDQLCEIPAAYLKASGDSLVPERCQEMFEQRCKIFQSFKVYGSHFVLQTNPSGCAEIIKKLVG